MDASPPKSQRAHKVIFRWCGRCVALGLLGVAGTGVYLNQVGVPLFAKNWLLDSFRARGLSLSFERVRVRLGRGIVAETIAVESLKESGRERVSASQLQLKLNWNSVFHLAPEIESIHLRDGRLEIPINEAGAPESKVELDHADAIIRLAGNDTWIIENFGAQFNGIEITAAGSVTNVSQLWGRGKSGAEDSKQWKKTLGEVAANVRKLQFASAPKIDITFHADPKSLPQSDVRIIVNAIRPNTPWGRAESFTLDGSIMPAQSASNSVHAILSVTAARPESPWVRAQELALTLRADFDGTNSRPQLASWELHARNANAPEGRIRTLELSGRTTPVQGVVVGAAPFRLPPAERIGPWHLESAPQFQSQVELHATGLYRTNLECARLDATGELLHSTNAWHEAQFQVQLAKTKVPQWEMGNLMAALRITPELAEAPAAPQNAWWNRMAPFHVHVSATATNVDSPPFHVDSAAISADYDTNRFSLDALQLQLYGGEVHAKAKLDVPSRLAHVEAESRLDAHALDPMLTETGRKWLGQYTWAPAAPPLLSGTVAAKLPAWTNTAPDWRAEVLPTLEIDATMSVTNGAYRGIPALGAKGHIHLKDRIWSLPDLEVARPEGHLELDYFDDIPTQRYRFKFHSTIDPRVGRALIPTDKAREAFDAWELTSPPEVDGVIQGQWHQPELTGISAHIAVTNTSWRGTHVDRVSGTITYTNQVIDVFDGAVTDGDQHGTVSKVEYQIPTQWVILSNAVSRVEPSRVTRLIGPKTHAMIEPFHFTGVPFVILNGRFDKYGGNESDVSFHVEAPGTFDWKLLHLNEPNAEIRYIGRMVLITNVVSKFYGGDLHGHLALDTGGTSSVPMTATLHAHASKVDVHTMMFGLGQTTNHLEGQLSATADLTSTDAQFPESWSGTGNANLHDGFLWDLPLVGIFTPILRTVSPDWGQARFTGGSATFSVTNGKLHSSDLVLKSASMKLDYSGSVDLKGQLDATMRVEMFRKVPVLGPIAGLALSPFEKLFEYKLTGSIKQPKAEPAYIPSFLLAPFHPIQTIKGLLPGEKKTNEPPVQ